MLKKIKLDEASATQLSAYANTQLGLTTRPNEGKTAILAKMANVGFTGGEIEADVTPARTVAVAAPAAKEADKGVSIEDRTVLIQIPEVEGPGGNEPVPVGVNGKVIFIPRKLICRVRYPYYEALKNATKIIYEPDTGPRGGLMPPKEVPMYGFSIIPEVEGVEFEDGVGTGSLSLAEEKKPRRVREVVEEDA